MQNCVPPDLQSVQESAIQAREKQSARFRIRVKAHFPNRGDTTMPKLKTLQEVQKSMEDDGETQNYEITSNEVTISYLAPLEISNHNHGA